MEKLQSMMFEAIGYKLVFSEEVQSRYISTVETRFDKDSEMKQKMYDFMFKTECQKEVLANSKHKLYPEFQVLAKMQLAYDLAAMEKKIKEISLRDPFYLGNLRSYKYLKALEESRHSRITIPSYLQEKELEILQAIQESHINVDDDKCPTSSGVDIPTIRMVFRTMICFNESLLANRYNYDEAKETIKTIFKLGVKVA